MPDGNNLTIDFNDASFDTSEGDVQPVPSIDVDVVFPLDDNPDLTVASGASDNRTSATPAAAIALMPTDAASSVMEEFLFEFDNDLNDDGTADDQGLKVTTSGVSGGKQVVNHINLQGDFENLHTDGSLDVYVSDRDGSGNQVFETVTLGEGSDTSGNDNITYVGGDTNGGDTGAGDDIASINVDASATMGGTFLGGAGFDMIKLVEGVDQDNGARVDFTSGLTGPDSAFITSLGGVGDGMSFDIDEFESIQLTDNADVIFIAGDTGESLTDTYDAVYLNGGGSNSMMKVQTGFTDHDMADVMYVHADSNVYLSFEFANESGLGIQGSFGADGDIDITGHIHGATDVGTDGEVIDVNIDQTGGSGNLTIDYLEATSNHDMITNLGDIGITVDLGGSDGMADVFTGSSTSGNDVLDAREAHSLEFASGTNGYIQVTGESEVPGSKGVIVNAELKDVDFIMVRNNPIDGLVGGSSTALETHNAGRSALDSAYQTAQADEQAALKAMQDFNGGLGDPGDTAQAGGTTQSVWENLIEHGNLPTRMDFQYTDTDQLTIAVDGVETLLSDIYVSHVRGDSTETSSGISGGGAYSEGGLIGNVFGPGGYNAIYAIKDPNANDGSMIQIFPEDFTWDLGSDDIDKQNGDWGLNYGSWIPNGNRVDVSFSTTPQTGHATEWVLVNQGSSRSADGGQAYDIPYANHSYHTIYNDGSLLTPGTGASEMPKASIDTPEITTQMIADYDVLETTYQQEQSETAAAKKALDDHDAQTAVLQEAVAAESSNYPGQIIEASFTSDIDLYQDMSALNGKEVISGLGDGATDAYGVGYDVVTSAQVDNFGTGSNMRVYYEGKHSDFVDTDDTISGTEGVLNMSAAQSDRGSTWESEVVSQYGPGQDPGFYIEVSGKKLAVTFDPEKGTNGEWKVDTSALHVAEGVTSITKPADEATFASDVMDRYDLKPGASHSYKFSDDIYLNATEEAITELLATGTASDKSFNFGFYTKMDLETDSGTVTVNLKLQDTVQSQVDTWLSSNPAPVIAEAIPEVTNAQYQAYQDLVQVRDNALKATQDFNGGLGDPGDTAQAGGTTQSVWENLIEHGNLPTRMDFQYTDTDQLTIAVDGVETLLSDIYVSHVRGDSTETSSGISGGGAYSEGGLIGNVFGPGGYNAIYAIKDPNANDGSMIQIFPEDFTWDLGSDDIDKQNGDWGLNYGSWIPNGNRVDVSFSTTPQTGHATEWVLVNQGSSRSADGGQAYDIPYANHSYHTIYNDGSLLTPGTGASEMPKASVDTPEITTQMIADYDVLEEALENAENALAGVSDPGSVRDAVAAVTQDDIDAHMANAPAPSYSFVLDASDIDVAVESFYNVAEDAGADVTSSSEAGEFVKIDNSADIALGNGGDDTYVVGADAGIYGGVALEYGNIGVRGGLTGSIDAVNINSVDSVDDLTFRRGEFRNEEDDNTLFIGDKSGNGQETVLFDNYNEYLDFRRVEYLTVEDGANNNEIFEIVTNNNLSDWDNEIYVADSDGGDMTVELGGLDYVFGSAGVDNVMIDLDDLIGDGKDGTIKLSGFDAADTLTMSDNGKLGEADEATVENALNAGIKGGDATVSFSYSEGTLTLTVDSLDDDLDMTNEQYYIS